jgi:translocation and assembly module TamB
MAPRVHIARRWLVRGLLVLGLLAAAVGATVAFLLGTEAGNGWLLARVPGLAVEQPQGRLFGGPLSAERVTLQTADRRIVVNRPAWRDAHWTFRPHSGAWFGVVIEGLQIERIDVGASAATSPPVEPQSLRLPLALTADGVRVDELAWAGEAVARELSGRVELGHAQGAMHRVTALAWRTERARFGGEASVQTDTPLEVEARAQAASLAGAAHAWSASASATGPLKAIGASARLESPEAAGAQLDTQATLAPFAAWPLSALQASLRNLDLSALRADAPRTRLAGTVQIETAGLDKPIAAQARLSNAEPGRWDQQRLPIAGLDLDLSGRADQRDVLAIQRLELRLPDGGGRATGQGQWRGDSAALDLTLQALRPAVLDTRAPAMTLGGTLALRASGLPAPDGSRSAAALQQWQARLALDGRLDARPTESAALRGDVKIERGADGWHAEVSAFDARAGRAQLKGRLQARRSAQESIRIDTAGDAIGFDPAQWWTGAPPARLHAQWQADLQAPASWSSARGAEAWLALRGQARIELQPESLLAGVPLQGQATLDGRSGGWVVDAQVQAAGNQVKVQGQLAPRALDDRWRAEIDAPALGALAPALAALGQKTALDGALKGQWQLNGRWPTLRSTGSLRATGLRWGDWAAQQLAAQWQAGPDRDAPLSLTLEGERLAQGALTLESVRAVVEGSLASHRIALDASSALRPPAWTDTLLGAQSSVGRGSQAQVRAEGRWQGSGNATLAGQWQLRVTEVDARGRDASISWLAARDAQLQLQFDAGAKPQHASLAPGRALVLGAPLAWREARWSAATRERAEQVALDAELESLPIAPWLARWQPEAGFGGDLAVKGRAIVRRGDGFSADIVLERAKGDLTVTDEGDTQALGLTDLRLALAADGGTWHFTQAVAGVNMGVLAGAQSLRIAPSATWPPPDAPMQGVLEWRVADLATWGRFTPPGWRVAGQLRTSAALGGRFGAPEIEGRMEGTALALRNLIQGVDLRDGELMLSLRGAEARIDRFVFKGGDGELRLAGSAVLGEQPRTNLMLTADKFRLFGRSDRRIVASGQAQLALEANTLALNGKLAIDEGLIDVTRGDAPSLDADVQVRGGRHGARAAAPEAEDKPVPRGRPAAAPRELRVDVQIDLGDKLRLRGRGLDTRLAGRVAITAPQGRLALNGQVRAVDGHYAAYGQSLEIERGVLAFSGEADNPRLDILAVRPNLDVKVGVQISGTAQLPRVRLASEPEMSEYDKLSWLVLGRASDGLARADTALLQRAALALLAGEGDSTNAALLANLGLDEFSVRQNESGDVRETVVTLGKQLSRRWYVGYERSVNSTTGTWQLVYRAAQRFTLRAQSGAENSLDAIWTWRWN